ncbi:hypothetical protein [Streptomyces sp. URMC 129]|uniref:hypothetical protein n=1 Tax=Streptomyces sp. URMC 129 TaxID=3423407 RepID=UPI003F1DEB8B
MVKTETDRPISTRAPRAPWLEILRQRWFGASDRALVLEHRDGAFRVLRPRTIAEAVASGRPRPRGRCEAAFHVRVGERSGELPFALPTEHGTVAMEACVLWWVHDPVQVVRTRTADGWAAVCRSLEGRLLQLDRAHTAEGRRLDATEVMSHLSGPQRLSDSGLSYRVTEVRSAPEKAELRLGPAPAAWLPSSWPTSRRADYEFCLQTVRSGPVSLAALWLLGHPYEIRHVLDWAVSHYDLIRDATRWEDTTARLLGNLPDEEKQELCRVLYDWMHGLGRYVPPLCVRQMSNSAESCQAGGRAGGDTDPRPTGRGQARCTFHDAAPNPGDTELPAPSAAIDQQGDTTVPLQ